MEGDARENKPCRTCTDFKSWSSLNKNKMNSEKENNIKGNVNSTSQHATECPVDKDELGRSSWNLLHTIAAYYPDVPTEEEKRRIADFFRMFALMYPCEVCAEDFQKQIVRFPPKTESQNSLTQWLCRAHNRINLRLGKPEFDCKKVNERWRDGWKDGSCD